MNEASNKAMRRRRRRPRNRDAEQGAQRHTQHDTQRTPAAAQAAPEPAPSPEMRRPAAPPPSAAEPADSKRSRSARRRVQRREPSPTGGTATEFALRGADSGSMEVGPLKPDIFIYTHTVRPRSLADSYTSGPGIAQRMTYEQPGAKNVTHEEATAGK